jgi:hypothetical protein
VSSNIKDLGKVTDSKIRDMVLLARICLQQGRLDDAIRLSSRALAFRQNLLGSRLKVCDSLYQAANLLEVRGDLSSSI